MGKGAHLEVMKTDMLVAGPGVKECGCNGQRRSDCQDMVAIIWFRTLHSVDRLDSPAVFSGAYFCLL